MQARRQELLYLSHGNDFFFFFLPLFLILISDDFNWNYGISLASTGSFKQAEEALLLVQSEKYKAEVARTMASYTALPLFQKKTN